MARAIFSISAHSLSETGMTERREIPHQRKVLEDGFGLDLRERDNFQIVILRPGQSCADLCDRPREDDHGNLSLDGGDERLELQSRQDARGALQSI